MAVYGQRGTLPSKVAALKFIWASTSCLYYKYQLIVYYILDMVQFPNNICLEPPRSLSRYQKNIAETLSLLEIEPAMATYRVVTL